MAIIGKVAVLGASGMVGSKLCRQLRSEGAEVIGIARFSNPQQRAALDEIGVQTVAFDVLRDDPATLPDASLLFLEIWDPSQHGGHAARKAIWDLNYTAVGRIVARYAPQADVINGSSGNVYGTSPKPRKETDAPRPNDEYGLARFAQEQLIDFLCQQAGSRAIHLRYYHANDEQRGIVRRMAEHIADGGSLGPKPDQRLQVIGLEDFVRCTLLAGKWRAQLPGVINICHPRIWTRRQLAQKIHERLGSGRIVFEREQGGEEDSVIGDPTRMIEHFGEPTVDLDELIDRVCKALPQPQ